MQIMTLFLKEFSATSFTASEVLVHSRGGA
jgi:hypothetical protein